jgi:uncharacterized protein YdeI (YjbR/CyaY-like superfamily)
MWSQVNVANVARLIEAGRMTPHGLKHVEAAQADGRWARAYANGKEMPIPDDLQAAIDAVPAARRMLAALSEQNRFAIAFRVFNMKTEAGRRKKIETFVAMLARGETVYPKTSEPGRGRDAAAPPRRIPGAGRRALPASGSRSRERG